MEEVRCVSKETIIFGMPEVRPTSKRFVEKDNQNVKPEEDFNLTKKQFRPFPGDMLCRGGDET